MSDLTFAIGVINFWNRLNISSPTIPGSLRCDAGPDQSRTVIEAGPERSALHKEGRAVTDQSRPR